VISGERSFHIDDQTAFSRLSGDFNPLHVDVLAARRSLAGGAVVHGIHLLLWVLNAWCATRAGRGTLVSLDVDFLKPVRVGAKVRLSGTADTAGANLTLHVGDLLATTIDLRVREGYASYKVAAGGPPCAAPFALDGAAISNAEGKLPLMLDLHLVSALAPALVRFLPAHQVAFMLATTRLVGMECPGLHSLYSELHFIQSVGAVEGEKCLAYRVKRFDKRFSLATILLTAPGLSGSIKAFLRPEPQGQPGCPEVLAALGAGVRSSQPFDGQRALVIGGSRGLGEVFAKVLAMGGAEVLLTYNHGEQDAAAIVADITANNGKAARLQYDVTSGQGASLAAFAPTHLYYMATPFIGSGQRDHFNAAAFERFCQYYVDGFAATFAGVRHAGLAAVYYPSSVFLDVLPADMSEYISAKGAGEALCATLAKAFPGLRFACPRLPRMATDQSASIVPSTNQAVLPLVLAQVEQFIKETQCSPPP